MTEWEEALSKVRVVYSGTMRLLAAYPAMEPKQALELAVETYTRTANLILGELAKPEEVNE